MQAVPEGGIEMVTQQHDGQRRGLQPDLPGGGQDIRIHEARHDDHKVKLLAVQSRQGGISRRDPVQPGGSLRFNPLYSLMIASERGQSSSITDAS